MKKIFEYIFIVFLLIVLLGFTASAEQQITVTVNGIPVEFDQPPIIIDGRTLVPVRAVMEAMGAAVTWRERSGTAFIEYNGISIAISVGDKYIYDSGIEIAELDVPAQIINDRVCIPIRAVAEAFYCTVDWNGDTQTVIITNNNADNNTKNITYTDVTDVMSDKLKEEFNLFVCAEAATAELADYNILENYDCEANNNNIREMIWFHMCGFACSYLKTLPNFKMFDEMYTEYYDYGSLMRTQAFIPDMIIKEYYNINKDIPKFEKISDIGSDSLYYSNWYYFANPSYADTGEYKAYIQNIYDLGNNQYYFSYKLASSLSESGVFDYVYDDTYYAIMERKYLNNENFSNLEFWSVLKTSTAPILE